MFAIQFLSSEQEMNYYCRSIQRGWDMIDASCKMSGTSLPFPFQCHFEDVYSIVISSLLSCNNKMFHCSWQIMKNSILGQVLYISKKITQMNLTMTFQQHNWHALSKYSRQFRIWYSLKIEPDLVCYGCLFRCSNWIGTHYVASRNYWECRFLK